MLYLGMYLSWLSARLVEACQFATLRQIRAILSVYGFYLRQSHAGQQVMQFIIIVKEPSSKICTRRSETT